MRLEPDVRTRLHGAVKAAGGDASAWTCHVLHQVTLADLPAHWQTGEADPHSHDSRYSGKRYMMRLDTSTWEKLEEFSVHFDKSAAEIIRQLVAQATIKDFPRAWQKADTLPRAHPRQDGSTQRRTP